MKFDKGLIAGSGTMLVLALLEGTLYPTKLGEDERTTVAYVSLYDYWNIFSRDIRIYVNHVPCQIGDWVMVELRFPLGTVTLSAQVGER